jgi:hypothetical protein
MNTKGRELKLKDEWYKEAREQTLETLPAFMKKVLDVPDHDYGTICCAVAACALGAARAADNHPNAGITGFQAGRIMWDFVIEWLHIDGPARLVQYYDMLYPQYEHKFVDKTINKSAADWLRDRARKELAEGPERLADINPDLKKHWELLAEGRLPWGYRVEGVEGGG